MSYDGSTVRVPSQPYNGVCLRARRLQRSAPVATWLHSAADGPVAAAVIYDEPYKTSPFTATLLKHFITPNLSNYF